MEMKSRADQYRDTANEIREMAQRAQSDEIRAEHYDVCRAFRASSCAYREIQSRILNALSAFRKAIRPVTHHFPDPLKVSVCAIKADDPLFD